MTPTTVLLALAALLAAGEARAVFECTNEEGETTYSDRRCDIEPPDVKVDQNTLPGPDNVPGPWMREAERRGQEERAERQRLDREHMEAVRRRDAAAAEERRRRAREEARKRPTVQPGTYYPGSGAVVVPSARPR